MTYEETTDALSGLEGSRVRLTFRNGAQLTGVVSTKDYGHCTDVRIDGHGGQSYEAVVQIERMADNGRYVAA